jgi:uncharacterized repeat protein (TIGR01451 family)
MTRSFGLPFSSINRTGCLRLLLTTLLALALAPQRPAQAVTITVTALTSGFTPANNNYTILVNALNTAASNDTIDLSGVFDWTEPNAAASWALGNDGVASTSDDYSLLVEAGKNTITMTAASLGAATIQGPGDLAAQNLEAFLVFDGGDNQGWTISNLRILDFDLGVGMFSGAGGVDAFNNTKIVNNHIRVATDLNATVAPADVNQNIGIHFSFGINQAIQGNTIEIGGDGVSNGANVAADVGMQSNTSGGNVYDGLLIVNNTIRILNAQSANPERVIGIWENSHGHSSNITIANNQFVNLAAGNNPAINLQRAFRVTAHSSVGTTVTYADNTVVGANIAFEWLSSSNFAGNQPVLLWGNTLANNTTGVLIQSNGLANLNGNRIESSGSGGGVHVVTGQLAASGAATNAVQANFIRNGSGDGILIDATAGAIGAIFSNDLSGNTGMAINNAASALLDASGNWYGSNTPAGVLAEVSANVDYTPWLNTGAGTAPTPGFQGDFSSLVVDDGSPQSGATTRIQEGVDLATAGGAVTIAAGIYTELVTVNKTVTLLGAQQGVDARARPFVAANESIVNGSGGSFSIQANNVILDGFTVQGATSATPLGTGIFLGTSSSGYTVRNNIVQDNIFGLYANSSGAAQTVIRQNRFENNNQPGAASGNGIYSDLGLTNALVDDNRFVGNTSAAVLLAGTQSNITITHNQVTSNGGIAIAGTTNALVINNTITSATTSGIVLIGGNNNVSVRENTVTNAATASGVRVTDDFGFGLNQNLHVDNNLLAGNAFGIRINAGAVGGAIDANCNRIEGNTSAGLRNDSTTIVDATLNWWGNASGPTHSSNPGGTGQLVQADPAVVDLLPFARSTSTCVTLTKTASAPSVVAGEQLTYTLVLSNAGSIAVPGLVLTDTLPADVTYASANPAPGNVNPLVWNVGTLAANQTLTYTVVVNVSSDATGSLVNGAQLATTALAGSATAAVTTSITTAADLSLIMSDSPDPAAAGANLAYTLRVANNGPSVATSVVVTDMLPTGVTFVGASGAGWNCGHAGGVVTCTRPNLIVGVAPDIVLTVMPRVPGAIANSAQVAAATSDANGGNNTVTTTTTVFMQLFLPVVKK